MKIRASLLGAVVASTLALASNAFAGDLYVGTQGGPWGRGGVYRYAGGAEWVHLTEGTVVGQAVMDIEAFGGTIYIATQTSSGYGGYGGRGQVWRFDGGTAWTKVADRLGTSCTALVVLSNELYAVVSDMNDYAGYGKLYRYDTSSGTWALAGSRPVHDASTNQYCLGFSRAMVSRLRGFDEIYIGDLDKDSFYRYNPTDGLRLVDENWRSCVYSLAEYKGSLFSGCWHGAFYQSIDGTDFVQKVQLGNYNHIWATAVHADRLYAGTGNGSWGSTNNGELRLWNGASLEVAHAWRVSQYAEGVTALVSSGDTLMIGLGIPEGYYSGDSGMAEVWMYDGSAYTRISGPDAFSGGVQSMALVGTLAPTLELVDVGARPPKVMKDGSLLLAAKGKGSFVATTEDSLHVDLPEGWTLQALEGPSRGTGVFHASVTLPCGAAPGLYTLVAEIHGAGNDGSLIRSNSMVFAVEVVRSMPETEMAAYRMLQEAILQARAWDLNLEDLSISVGIPEILDLTAAGVPLEQKTVTVEGNGKVVSYYTYQGTWNGYSYGPYTGYWSWSGWTYAGWWTYQYEFTGSTWSSTHFYETETRPVFEFPIDPPAGAFSLLSASMTLTPGWSWPWATHIFNMNDILGDPSASNSDLFLDAENGTLYAGLGLTPFTPHTAAVPAPLSGSFRSALDLQQEVSPKISYNYAGSWYGTTYKYSCEQAFMSFYSPPPRLDLTYLCGQLRQGILLLMLADIEDGDGSRAVAIGSYLNPLYGKTPDQWGLRHQCADYLVIAKTCLTLSGNVAVLGNAHSDADLVVHGNVTVQGQADAVRPITVHGRPNVSTFTYVDDLVFPAQADVLSAVGTWRTLNGPLHITPKNARDYRGAYFVHGDLRISGNMTLDAAFVATGNIHVSGVVTLNGGLYTQNGSIDVNGSSVVQGRVIGNEVRLAGNVVVKR